MARPRLALRWTLAGTVLVGTAAASQEGYRLTSTEVVVDRAGHWSAWQLPEGALELAADGTVSPRGLRRRANAALDAHEYTAILAGADTVTGGVYAIGSGEATGSLVRDGDPLTWWEPDPADDVEDWYVEIDLGRAVIAEQVVVRFAPEGEGDPFLKFRVRLSNGVGRLYDDLEYFRAGQVVLPNKDERLFVFDVKPQRPLPPGVTGQVVQFVRLEALGSDGDRGREVTPGEFAALDPEDRGAVDHYRRTVAGREIRVAEATWSALPEAERGPVRRFRRERPRVAELEVITPGENVVLNTQRRLNLQTRIISDLVRTISTDGFFYSYYPIKPYDQVRRRNQLEVDLGAKYWLDRVRMVTPEEPLRAYQVLLSDGSIDPNGERVWNELGERLNRDRFLQMEERFPLQEVRHVQLRALALLGTEQESGQLAELLAFGEGFVSEVVLTSPLITLPGSRMFSFLSWEGEAPNDTRIEVRTRSGDDLRQELIYYDVLGYPMEPERWERARESNRGPVDTLDVPGPKWSSWSEVYRRSPEPFRSPSPRRYAMAEVRLLTVNPLRRASIRGLRIGLTEPLVDQVWAEIHPTSGVPPGVDQEFTIYMLPRFRAGDPGFDRMGIRSSSSAPMELLSLRAGSEAQLRTAAARDLLPTASATPVEGGVDVRFPAPVASGRSIYAARIRTQVYLSGTTFRIELSLSSRPGTLQIASEGDATDLARSQSLVVISDLEAGRLLAPLEVTPPVLTPNGDGVNDEAAISFQVFQVRGPPRLSLRIHDLSGRLVRDLTRTPPQASGRHEFLWDGRDDAGALVAPGVYAARVEVGVHAGGRRTSRVRLVHVAY